MSHEIEVRCLFILRKIVIYQLVSVDHQWNSKGKGKVLAEVLFMELQMSHFTGCRCKTILYCSMNMNSGELKYRFIRCGWRNAAVSVSMYTWFDCRDVRAFCYGPPKHLSAFKDFWYSNSVHFDLCAGLTSHKRIPSLNKCKRATQMRGGEKAKYHRQEKDEINDVLCEHRGYFQSHYVSCALPDSGNIHIFKWQKTFVVHWYIKH
jgi:hypothetical protein